jgi:hypothetical protein
VLRIVFRLEPAFFAAIVAFAMPARASATDATPSPVPSARPTAARDAERLVVASCPRTVFYSWPAKDAAPAPSSYPPATNGDAFHIIGSVQQTLDGMAVYETTIDVVAPWGAGKHYWVSQRCVNAG